MPYAAVKTCIYCGAKATPEEALGEEHIIPASFGGTLRLPEASCRNCEKITGAFESHCVDGMISTARPHLSILGRQKANFNKKGPVYLDGENYTRTISVPIDQHPGALMIPKMPFPAIMAGVPIYASTEIPPAVRLAIKPMTPDIVQRARRISPLGLNLTRGQSAADFYRLIAKIAHAFTAAELGLDSFDATLKNLIFLYQPLFADYFVGSGFIDEEPTEALHEVSFANSFKMNGRDNIVVRIRLFASMGMPTHYAISGAKR